MNPSLRSALYALSLGIASLTPACASQTPTLVTAGESQLEDDREDKMLRYTATLRELRAHPRAARVNQELDLAQRWLRRVESWLDDPDHDEEELALYLEVIETQLVSAQTTLVRLDEEARLDQARVRYDARARSLHEKRDALEASSDQKEQ
jgi:hypothetical protein